MILQHEKIDGKQLNHLHWQLVFYYSSWPTINK